MHRKLKKIEPFNPKSKLENSKETNQQHLLKQSSTNVDKHMTSVTLPSSIQTRLKIQQKFIHQKENRNQEGVYRKHAWKHFLLVRKSPLVFVSSDFSTSLFRASFLFPSRLLSLPFTILESPKKNSPPPFFFLSHIYISAFPKETFQICWRKIPSFLHFLNLLSFLILFPFYNRFPHRNNICVILLKNKISFFSKFC